VESPYYARTGNSWKEYFQQEFPYRGIHYVNISILDGKIHPSEEGRDWKSSSSSSSRNPYPYLKEAEEQLASDVSMFPSPTLITRGGLLSMVAQFYLESYALSGLVMLDPYISPEVASSSEPCLNTSTSCSMLLHSMEVEKSKRLKQQHVLLEEDDLELHLLKMLSIPNTSRTDVRLLKLEPSSVPMLLVYPTTSAIVPLTGFQEWTKTSVQQLVDYHGKGTVDVHYLQQQQDQKAVETINTIISWLDEKVG
jgi:hypothetical protein